MSISVPSGDDSGKSQSAKNPATKRGHKAPKTGQAGPVSPPFFIKELGIWVAPIDPASPYFHERSLEADLTKDELTAGPDVQTLRVVKHYADSIFAPDWSKVYVMGDSQVPCSTSSACVIYFGQSLRGNIQLEIVRSMNSFTAQIMPLDASVPVESCFGIDPTTGIKDAVRRMYRLGPDHPVDLDVTWDGNHVPTLAITALPDL